MATDLVVTCENHRLVPASAIDYETLDRIRSGVAMACKLWMPRSLPHNRWYRALVAAVAEANGMPAQVLHETLKLKAGLFHINLSGDIPTYILHSTAFEAMSEPEFSAYTDFALMTIMSEYVAGIKKPELIRKVDELAGLSYDSLPRHKVKQETAA